MYLIIKRLALSLNNESSLKEFNFQMSIEQKNKFQFILLFLINAFISTSALPPDTAKVYAYGGPGSEIAYGIKIAPDSGLYLAGISNYYGPGGNSIYLIKTDKNGMHQWSRMYGGVQIDQSFDLAVQGDSALFIVGFTNSLGNGGYDGYVLKTDTGGNLLWEKTYGGSDWDFFYSINILNDGSAILCGKTFTLTNGRSDGYVVKIDPNGYVIWSRNIGGLGDESFNSCDVSGNNIFLVGTSSTQTNSNTSGYLVKMDLEGDILNEYFFTGEGNDGLNSIRDFNGSLIMGGYSQHPDSINRNVWLFKTDTAGIVIWNSNVNSIEDDYINDITLVSVGQIVYTGEKNPSGLGEKSMFIVRIDSFGNYRSGASFGGGNDEEGFSTVVMPDNRIAFCGYTTSYGYGNEDAYLVILPYDTISAEYILDTITYLEQLSLIGVNEIAVKNNIFYPNPSTGIICLNDNPNHVMYNMNLFSVTGKQVYSSSVYNQKCFDFSDFQNGMYFYKIILANANELHGILILE